MNDNEMSKSVLMVATVASMIGQFNMNNLKLLIEMGFEPQVACDFRDRSVWSLERIKKFKNDLEDMNIVYHQIDFSRNLIDVKSNLKAFRQIQTLIKKEHFSFIHCHTPIASVITRIIAHQEKVKVIYTAHGFHFYKGAPIKNWIMFYPVEKLLSYWTDTLIVINKEDYARAKKHFHAKRLIYVPGVGIDTKKFHSNLIDIDRKRAELGLSNQNIMLLSIGELSHRKNHELVIRALYELHEREKFHNIRYFICGTGSLASELKLLVHKLKLDNTVQFLGFRTDISELCQAADLYIFPSLQEGLPVVLMEAVACRTPIICSKIRGNEELIKNEKDRFFPNDVSSLVDTLDDKLLNCEFQIDRTIVRDKMKKSIDRNYQNLQKFGLSIVENKMNGIYHSLDGDEKEIINYCLGLQNAIARQKYCKRLNIEEDAILLFSAGELNENKNHITIIRTMPLLEKKVHYLIAGTGSLKKELEKEATNLRVNNRVHMLGYRTDINDILRNIDIYLLPSIREGLNVSLMEAMASGLPCICSDIRGNRDLIFDYKGGMRVHSTNVDEWYKAICEIQNLDCIKMGRYNLNIICNFSKNVVIEKMKKIYGSMHGK